HDAAGAQHLSGGDQSREDAHPQAQGSAGRGRDRAQLPQGYDSPVVPEPDQPRGGCPWRGSGGADLLRQARAPAERRGSSDPGGAPKLPAFYNPRTHPQRNVRRRNVVLELMRDQGFLAPEECELWQAYPLVLTTNRTNYGDVAPYFVEWLRSTQLDARFGRDLYEGGLRI